MSDLLEVLDPGLLELADEDAVADRIAGGFGFTEGPVWFEASLLFSDIRNNRIVRWRQLPEGPEVTTFGLGQSNGLTLDGAGKLLAAEHGGRRISRIARDGSRTTLVEDYQGKRLNSPNDIVVRSADGSIYFTDPPYAVASNIDRVPGWWSAMLPGRELEVNGVYRLAPDGVLTLVADDFELPNGLAFSPDERVLYVDDSNRRHIRALEVADDGSVTHSRVLLDMASDDEGVPDGMKVNAAGNIFCTGPGGIWVCRPTGELLGRIRVPEAPSNVAWGEDGHELFVTARTSLYRIRLKTAG